MKKHYLGYLAIVLIFAIAIIPSEAMNIPPTAAFSKIFVNGQSLIAQSYNDLFRINTQGQINATVSSHDITLKLTPQTCPSGQAFTRIDSNGFFVCAVPMP